MARLVTKGICDAALEKIGAKTKSFQFYSMLRRVNAGRQNEIANLMAACADYSFSLLGVLTFGSKAHHFIRAKRRMRGVSRAELALIEKTVPPLEAAFWTAARSYADDARALMVTEAYVRRIIANPGVAARVRAAHPTTFLDLNRLGLNCAAAASNAEASVSASLDRPDAGKAPLPRSGDLIA